MEHVKRIKRKILNREELLKKTRLWRFKDQKVAFTNGCFDIIHPGHIQSLAVAADTADRLIVGLNSDSSVKKLKGDSRPIQDEQSRAIILASFSFVSAVVIFAEETPLSLIELFLPEVLVKGGDYEKSQIVGADVVEANGGEVVVIPFLEGHSTTNIIEGLMSQ